MARETAVPDKLYFRIGEVAELCGLPAYVLRFWESEFPQLKPTKGGTGQRLYRQRDVRLALRIKDLLYEGGFTIPGARRALLAEQQRREPQLALGMVGHDGEQRAEQQSGHRAERSELLRLREGLTELLEMLEGSPQSGTRKVHPIKASRRRMTPAATSQELFEYHTEETR